MAERSSRFIVVASLALGATLAAASGAEAQTTVIVLTKVADATPVNAGDAIGFTLTVSNAGGVTATTVAISDTLPSGLTWSDSSASCSITNGVLSCSFGSIVPGGSASVHVSATSNAASCAAPLLNIATATATNASASPGAATITVNCPDLELKPTADATPLRARRQIGLTLSLTNRGAGSAKNVNLTAHLPTMNGLVWTQNPSNISCFLTGQSEATLVTCSSSELKTGESISAHFTSPTTSNSFFGDATVGPFDGTVTTTNDASGGDHFDSLQLPVRYSGDADGNGAVDVNDVFYLVNFLFAGGPPP